MLDSIVDAGLILASLPGLFLLVRVAIYGIHVWRFDVLREFKTLRSWRNRMVVGVFVTPILFATPFVVLPVAAPGVWRKYATSLNRFSIYFGFCILQMLVAWFRLYCFAFSRKRWREAGAIIRNRMRSI